MYSVHAFEYTDSAPLNPDVIVDETIHGRDDLLRQLALKLAFPDYFGENWDALIDCLSDLSWLRSREAVIYHEGLPRLSTRDLRCYLECLLDAAGRRSPEEVPKLRLVFRTRDRGAIAVALSRSG